MEFILEKSKEIALLLVAVVSASAFGAWILLFDNRPQGEEYRLLAEQLLEKARIQFQQIREEPVREVVLEVVNQSWVLENWGAGYIDTKQTTIEQNTYKALFMIPKNSDLYEVKLSWTGMYHAAKWNGTIYVVEDNFDITKNSSVTATFVHELTHIMQDDYSLPQRTTFDGSKALTSLKEGDATLMADAYKNDGVVPASAPIIMPSSSSIPETIDWLNRFVYRYGVEFVKTVYQQSGWNAVNQAYINLPNTTEQILHPEKYLSQENALSVQAPTVNEDWILTKTDSFGEYFIYVMLDHWISAEEAQIASTGWGGDVFSYYENGDDFLFTWNIMWDTEADAHEFYETFHDMMAETLADHVENGCWFDNGRYLSVQLNQNSTLLASSENLSIVQ